FDWRQNRTLDALIEQTQHYQSEVNRFYIDRLRLRKYRPTGGIVPFMLLDSNPAVQWSVIDYWRVPKASYWAMRDAFRPQYAFTLIDKPRYSIGDQLSLPIYGVNDARETMRYQVSASVTSPELRRVAELTAIGEFGADCEAQQLGRLKFVADRRGQYEVQIRLDCGGEHFVNTYRLRVGQRPRPRNLTQRAVQALAASLAIFH
ncbi:MAG: hypothetical protein JOZ51_05185, partial [Chloroflexi bacterium]|nr:hypothetical protein [Chloroflexota bacterium]